MGSTRLSNFTTAILGTFALVVLLTVAASAASTTKVIYSFTGGNDGEYTDTELVMDNAGNMYGTSVQGGLYGGGTIFQVTPAGVHTVLYNFTGGADGGEPYKGVTLDAKGNLYGTAVTGGGGSCEGGCGVVFELANSGGGVWNFSVIHTFTGGKDGSGVGAPVVLDKHGNLYGMAPTGGALGFGTIYLLKPGSSGWTLKVIHTFTGGADGLGGSAGRMIFDAAGHVFGVSTVGGLNGDGLVFELTPTSVGEWQLTSLYDFKGSPDGALPYGGLVLNKGNLYGTTYYEGAHDLGTVYELARRNGTWTERVLHSFQGGSDGDSPISTLVADAAGNLYGTTSNGGSVGCGCGTIFKMSRNSLGVWTESVVYRFKGQPDGGFAYNGLVSDSTGNFYGATVHGGTTNDGAIYKLTP